MSRPKNDRKLQSESGKTFQDPDPEGFVRAIAVALKTEFGATPSALKTVAQLTRSNERPCEIGSMGRMALAVATSSFLCAILIVFWGQYWNWQIAATSA